MLGVERDRRRVRNADAVEQRVSFQLVEHLCRCRAGANAPRSVSARAAATTARPHRRRPPACENSARPAAASRASASGRFGNQKRRDRLWRADAVDDRLDREIGIEPRRGADHDHDQIELRRGGQHVERALHHLVLRAGEREIDDPRRRDVDAGHLLDARQGLRRRRLQRDAARGERIDHHGGAAGGGGHHGDGRPPRARARRPARGRAAESPRSVLPAYRRGRCRIRRGTCRRCRPRPPARRCARRPARAPRPSARACRPAPACRAGRLPARRCATRRPSAWFRETARNRRCRDRRGSRRKSRRSKDRPRCRPTRGRRNGCRAPCRATGTCRSCRPECEAAKMRPTGRSGSSNAALAVRNVLCRRSTTPRLEGPTSRVPESFRSCLIRVSRAVPSAPVSLKPLASAVTTGTPMPSTFLDRLHRRLGRRDDIGVIRHLRQIGERRPGALAQHLVAPRIDRIDAAGITRLPQIFQRPAGGFRRVVGLPDDRDRLRREQDLRQRFLHSAASDDFGLAGRWSKRRSNTCSAMRFFSISTEPPAIIQPRQRRMQYSTSDDLL